MIATRDALAHRSHAGPMHDAIVVGCGPAGSVTALLLARAGFDVLLIDRAVFPRPKPCGDCLSLGTTDLLRRLDLLATVEALPAAHLDGWRITAPDGASFTASFARNGRTSPGDGAARALAVERRLLDDALLRAAVDAGATFLPDTRVTDLTFDGDRVTGVVTGTQTLRARLVIGADGLRSIVATRLDAVRRRPRLRKVSLTFHVEFFPDDVDRLGEMHLGDGLCVGIAPVTADARLVNLTLVADADRYGPALARDRIAFTEAVVRRMPRLRGRMDRLDLNDAPPLASGPFDRPVRAVTFTGAALVGDAAGYYDPFTGQGVHQAIASARLLARTAARALIAGDVSAAALRPYAVARSRIMNGPRALQHVIECVLGRPRLANHAIRRIGRAPPLARALIDVTGDVAPISRLVAPTVLHSLVSPDPESPV